MMTSTRRRIVLLLAIAAAIALGVALVYTMSPSAGGVASAGPTSPSSSPRPAIAPPTTPPTSTATSTARGSAPTTPAATVTTRAPYAGPGLTEVGIHVVAQPDADGELEVVEQILLARPVSAIGLAPPTTPTYPGLEGLAPQVVGLQVESRGVPVAVAFSDPLLTRQELRLAPTTSLSLRYHLANATRRTAPSTLGRALTVLPAISAGDNPELPVVIEVVGAGVRNVLCTQLTGDQQFCAVQSGQTWTTTDLTTRPISVIAQLDLPPPG